MSQALDPVQRPQRHRASWKARLGPASCEAEIEISTGGLLAVGALVSAILLSVAPVVWASTRERRRRGF